MSTFVKPINCRRCKGTGEFGPSYVNFGICKRCNGAGVEEGDKATLQAAKVRAAAHKEAAALAWEAGKQDRLVWVGWCQLEEDDPARFAKAIQSVLAGHPQVFAALAAYAH